MTFKATVTNRSTGIMPFASVQFMVDGVQLDSIPIDNNGQASIIVSGFDAGDYPVQAVYHDNTGPIPDFTDSQASLNEHINSPPPPPPAPSTSPPASPPAPPTSHPASPPAPPTPPPAPPAPNSNFTLVMAAVANNGTITLVESAPDPGAFTATAMTRSGYIASATALTHSTNCKRSKHGRMCVVNKRGPALYGAGSATTSTPGTVRLTIKPNAKAKWALTHGTTLQVRISVTFHSARGGVPKTAVTTVTVKGKRSARKHRFKRHT